ncbi:NifU family protein [Nonomuraea rhodomycinica]|uniref:NifU family protein n=1 Tax=Nonomuraea rhodomycinica TaxID=1712872 RepID=A0A7Y6IQ45_9ACTN|nr:NifU family protein [Nonomuraea rhodomycinica]NUW42010.1 NifU family protein [Nonomuraea rhodomycinica]
MDDHEVTERVRRVEELLEGGADPRAVELAEALLDLYGEALARVMTVAAAAGGGLPERIAADDLVAHLLLLHDLHPLDAATRVRHALERVRDRLGGAEAVLVAVEEDAVRLRLRPAPGAKGGCGSTAARARSAVESAVRDAAPEFERVVVEEEAPAAPEPVVIPVESLLRVPGTRA